MVLTFFAQISLKVGVQDTDSVVEVQVKDSAAVIAIIFRAAEVAGIKPKDNYALFEVSENLKIGKVKNNQIE